MRTKIAKLALTLALPLGVALMPAAAHAAETPPPSQLVVCANLRAQLSTAQAKLSSVNSLIAGYERTITSLQTAQQTLVSRGLGESSTYASLSTQISYYQNLLGPLYAQRSSLQWQIFCLQWQLYSQCGAPAPF